MPITKHRGNTDRTLVSMKLKLYLNPAFCSMLTHPEVEKSLCMVLIWRNG